MASAASSFAAAAAFFSFFSFLKFLYSHILATYHREGAYLVSF
jgi:hypothetical protein